MKYESARAGVHGGDEHEAGRKDEGARGARDVDAAVLHRLA